jgi:hypothetical protein
MSWLGTVPAEVLWYEAALLLLAAAFVLYALVLRSLLALIGYRRLWVLPLAGSVLLVASAGLHLFAAVQLTPLIPSDPGMYVASMALRAYSLLCLTACGALGAVAGWLYYHGMGD